LIALQYMTVQKTGASRRADRQSGSKNMVWPKEPLGGRNAALLVLCNVAKLLS
jgi:hypothetical protein